MTEKTTPSTKAPEASSTVSIAPSQVKLPEEVVTHPLVLLSIVDHYNKSNTCNIKFTFNIDPMASYLGKHS
jgi:hypothetical protein